jgi:hypothetical protein
MTAAVRGADMGVCELIASEASNQLEARAGLDDISPLLLLFLAQYLPECING